MNIKQLTGLALVAVLPFAAQAQDITLTFEGASSFASINDFYNGGTDGEGASGPNYGISFSADALALKNDELGPYFSNAPTPETIMFAPSAAAVMNVAAGFTGQLDFWYASESSALNLVTIWSGLDATGTLLASASLFGNATIGCTDSPYCRFDLTSVQFAGIGQSVSFGSNDGTVAYDNISLTAVPEPGTVAMLLAGLGVVGQVARRRRPV
jgi:hypothetical protein